MKKVLPMFGAVASIIFITGTIFMGMFVDGYSPISGTVSEIGSIGSAMEVPYKVMLLSVGFSVSLFSFGIFMPILKEYSHTILALFILSFGISDIGMAIFPTPHKLHNIFGIAHLVGYFSPLVFLLTTKLKETKVQSINRLVMVVIIIFLFLNLSPIFTRNLFPLEYYGVVQRALLYTFYLWLGWIGVLLFKQGSVKA